MITEEDVEYLVVKLRDAASDPAFLAEMVQHMTALAKIELAAGVDAEIARLNFAADLAVSRIEATIASLDRALARQR
jgi:hypothetical protein